VVSFNEYVSGEEFNVESDFLGDLDFLVGDLDYEFEYNLVRIQLELLIECGSLSGHYLDFLVDKILSLKLKYPEKDQTTNALLEFVDNAHLVEKSTSSSQQITTILKIKTEALAPFIYLFAENKACFDKFSGVLLVLEPCSVQILHLGMLKLMQCLRGENDLNFQVLLDKVSVCLDSYFNPISLGYDWPASKQKDNAYRDLSLVEELILFVEKKFNFTLPKVSGSQVEQIITKDSLEVIRETHLPVTTSFVSIRSKENSLREAFSFVKGEEEVMGVFDSSQRLIDVIPALNSDLLASYCRDGCYAKELLKKTIVNLCPDSSNNELTVIIDTQSDGVRSQIKGRFQLEEDSEFYYELSHVVLSSELDRKSYLVCKRQANSQWSAIGFNPTQSSGFNERILVYKRCVILQPQETSSKRASAEINGAVESLIGKKLRPLEGSKNELKASSLGSENSSAKLNGAIEVKESKKARLENPFLEVSSSSQQLDALSFLLRSVHYQSQVLQIHHVTCAALLPSTTSSYENIWLKYPIPCIEESRLPPLTDFLQESSQSKAEHEAELNLFSQLWHKEIAFQKEPCEFMQILLDDELLEKGKSLKAAAQILGGAWVKNSKMYKGEELVSLEGWYSKDALEYVSKVITFMLHPSVGLSEQEKNNYQLVIGLFKEAIDSYDYLNSPNYSDYFEKKKQYVSRFSVMQEGEKKLIPGGIRGSNSDVDLQVSGHAVYYLVECTGSDEFFISIYNRGAGSNGKFLAYSKSSSNMVPSKVRVGPFTRQEIADITLWNPFLDQNYLSDMPISSNKEEGEYTCNRLTACTDLEWLFPYIYSLGKEVVFSNWLNVQKSGNCSFKSIFAFVFDQDPKNYFFFSTLIRHVALAVKEENILANNYSRENLPAAFKMGKYALQQLSKRLVKSEACDLPLQQQSLLRMLHYRLSYVYYKLLENYETKNTISYSLAFDNQLAKAKKGVAGEIQKSKLFVNKLSSPKLKDSYIGYDAYNSWKIRKKTLSITSSTWPDSPDKFGLFISKLDENISNFEEYFGSVGQDDLLLGVHYYASQNFVKPLPLDFFVNTSTSDAFFSSLSYDEIRDFSDSLGRITSLFTKTASKRIEHGFVLDLWKLYYIQLCVSHYYNLHITGKQRFTLEGKSGAQEVDKMSFDWSLLKHLSSIFEFCVPNNDYQQTLDLLRRGFSTITPSGENNFYESSQGSDLSEGNVECFAQGMSAFDPEYCYLHKDSFISGRKKSKFHSFLSSQYVYKGSTQGAKEAIYTLFSGSKIRSLEKTTQNTHFPKSYVDLGRAHYNACQFTLNFLLSLDEDVEDIAATFQSKRSSVDKRGNSGFFGGFDFLTPFITNLIQRFTQQDRIDLDAETLKSYNQYGLGKLSCLITTSLRNESYLVLVDGVRDDLANNQSNNLLFELLQRCYNGDSLKYFINKSPHSFWQITDLIIKELELSLFAAQLNKKIDIERVLVLSMIASKIFCISKELESSHLVVNNLRDALLSFLENYDKQLQSLCEEKDHGIDVKIVLQQAVLLFLSKHLGSNLEAKSKILSSFCLYKSKEYLSRKSNVFEGAYVNLMPALSLLSSKEILYEELEDFPDSIVLFFASYFDENYLEIIEEIEKDKNMLSVFLSNAYPLYTKGLVVDGNSKLVVLEGDEREEFFGSFLEATKSSKRGFDYKEEFSRVDKFWSQEKYQDLAVFGNQEEKVGWIYDTKNKCFQLISKRVFVSLKLDKLLCQSKDVETSEFESIVSKTCYDILGNQNLSSSYSKGEAKAHFYFEEGNFVARKTCSVFINFLSNSTPSYLVYDCLPNHKRPLEDVSRYVVVNSNKGLLEEENRGSNYFTVEATGKKILLSGKRYMGVDIDKKGLIEFSSIYFDGKQLRHFDRPGQVLHLITKETKEVSSVSFLKRLVTDLSGFFIWVNESSGDIEQIDLPLKSFLEKELLSLVNINGKLTLNLFPDYNVSCQQHIRDIPYTKNHLVFENQNSNKKVVAVYPYLASSVGLNSSSGAFYLDSFGEINSDRANNLEEDYSCFLYKSDRFGNLYSETFTEQIYLVYLYCLNENFIKAAQELNNIQINDKSNQVSKFDNKIIKAITLFYPKTSEQIIFIKQFQDKFNGCCVEVVCDKSNSTNYKGVLDDAFCKVLDPASDLVEKEEFILYSTIILSKKEKKRLTEEQKKTNIYCFDTTSCIKKALFEGKCSIFNDQMQLLSSGIDIHTHSRFLTNNSYLSTHSSFFINVCLTLENLNFNNSQDCQDFQLIKRYIISAKVLRDSNSIEKEVLQYYLKILKIMVMCLDRNVPVQIPRIPKVIRHSEGLMCFTGLGLNTSELDSFSRDAVAVLNSFFSKGNYPLSINLKSLLLERVASKRTNLKESNFVQINQANQSTFNTERDTKNIILPSRLEEYLSVERDKSLIDKDSLERLLVEVKKIRDGFCEKLIRIQLEGNVNLTKDSMFLFLSKRSGFLPLLKDITKEYLKSGINAAFKGLSSSEDMNFCESLLLNYNICWWYTSHLEALIKPLKNISQRKNQIEFDVERSKVLDMKRCRFLKENLLEKRSTPVQVQFIKEMFCVDKVIGLLSMGAGKTTFIIPIILHELLFIEQQGACVVLSNPSVYSILTHEMWKMGVSCVSYEFTRQNCTENRLLSLIKLYQDARKNKNVVVLSEKTLQTVLSMPSERLELTRSINNEFINILQKKYKELPSSESFSNFLKRVDNENFIRRFALSIDKPFNQQQYEEKFKEILSERRDLHGLSSIFISYLCRYSLAVKELDLVRTLVRHVTSVAIFVDEADMYGVKKSHNFPVGKEEPFSHVYFDCIANLYFEVLPETRFFDLLQKNQQTFFTDKFVQEELLPSMTEEVLKLLEKTISTGLIEALGRSNIVHYLCGNLDPSTSEIQSKTHQSICEWLKEESSVEKMVFATNLKVYRELLVTYLPAAFKNSIYSDYAPSYKRAESLICIPQIANGRAKEGSQFKDFMYTSMLTCQFYLQDFSRESTYLSFLKFLSEQSFSKEDSELIVALFEISSLEQLADNSWILSKSGEVKQRIQGEVSGLNKPLIRLIGRFFKEEVLSKEIKSSSTKVSTYLRELISSFEIFKGASGTSSEEFNLPCPVIDVDSTYQKVTDSVCAQGSVFVRDFETPEQFLKKIKEVCSTQNYPLGLVRAIIDVSPLFKGITPQEVILLLKEHFSEVKNYFITYGESAGEEYLTSTKKVNNTSTRIRSEIRDYIELVSRSENKCDDILVFHDHLHIRAGNIWLPKDSIGVVTFDSTVSYHDLLQGACRMRQLVARNHKVWIFIVPELAREIKATIKKEEATDLTVVDVIEFAELKTKEKEKSLYLQGKLLEAESVLKMETLEFLQKISIKNSLILYSSIFHRWLTKSIESGDIEKMGLVHSSETSLNIIKYRVEALIKMVNGSYNSLIASCKPKLKPVFIKMISSLRKVLENMPPLPEFVANTSCVEGDCELQVELQDHLQFSDDFADFSNYELQQPVYFLENLFLISSDELVSQLKEGNFQGEQVKGVSHWLSTNSETNSFAEIFSEDIYVTKSQAITFKEQDFRSTMLTLSEKPICYYLILKGNTQSPKLLVISLEQYVLLEKHYLEVSKKSDLPQDHLDGTWIVQSDGHVVLGKEEDVAWVDNFLLDSNNLSPKLTEMLIGVLVLSRHWASLVSPKIKPLLQNWLQTEYKVKKQLIGFLLKKHPEEAASKSGIALKRIFDS
jgi:hypothetical protein